MTNTKAQGRVTWKCYFHITMFYDISENVQWFQYIILRNSLLHTSLTFPFQMRLTHTFVHRLISLSCIRSQRQLITSCFWQEIAVIEGKCFWNKETQQKSRGSSIVLSFPVQERRSVKGSARIELTYITAVHWWVYQAGWSSDILSDQHATFGGRQTLYRNFFQALLRGILFPKWLQLLYVQSFW